MFETYNYFRQYNDNQEIKDHKEFYKKFSNDREFGGEFTHYDKLVKSRFFDVFGFVLNAILRKQPKSILDIGCGGGINLPLANIFPNIKYMGVDYAEKALEASQKVYPNIIFQKEDAFNLSFENNVFDSCILSNILILYKEAEDRQSILKEAHRVLSQDGMLILIVWKDSFLLRLSILLSRMIAKKKKITLPNDFMGIHFKENEVVDMLKISGFNTRQIHHTGINYGILESIKYLNMSKYKRNFGSAEKEFNKKIDLNVDKDILESSGSKTVLAKFVVFISKIFPTKFSMYSVYIATKE